MKQLTIGDLARRFGIRTSALRFYERVGLLLPPERKSGQRRYNAQAVTQVAAIQAAQRAGFALAEIRTLLDGFARDTPAHERWRALATHKLEELDELIARAEEMKQLLAAGMACTCASFETCPLLAEDAAPLITS